MTAGSNKEFFDGVKLRELKAKFDKVALRTLRDATKRILGDRSKAKGAIKKIYSIMLRMPKTAIDKWKKYLEGHNNKSFFDNIRSLKVKSVLEGIVKISMRDASQRVLGGGIKIKGAMQNLIYGLKSIPKKEFRRWSKTA